MTTRQNVFVLQTIDKFKDNTAMLTPENMWFNSKNLYPHHTFTFCDHVLTAF